MSWGGFGGGGGGGGGGGFGQVQQPQQQQGGASEAIAGNDLPEVTVKDPAFQHVASNPDDRLRLSDPWPEDRPPPPTASLLSIASQKGLLAAAGPDSLSIVSTDKARIRYLMRRRKADATAGRNEDEPSVLRLEPDVKLSVPRVSHVAFSADESCLVIAAEQGGGLAVYDTNALSNGAQPAFQIATNGTSVRHLLPNPDAKDLSHLFGIVLSNGQLLLADLKARALVTSDSGNSVFHEQVSVATWSKLGKQMVAGLADSTAIQVDQKGNVKDRIPRPPQLEQLKSDYEGAEALPITSASWISTHEFLFAYTPSYPATIEMPMLDSVLFIAKRPRKGEPFTFHKFELDPCPPFGMIERTPAQHFMLRLSEWQNISDMLIVASTASTDIGILAQFKDGGSGQFVTATVDESRQGRALLPLKEGSGADTSVVGMALDFSTKEVAPEPVPNEGDDIRHSTIPLPAMCVLNNDGVLLMWWVVYSDAIKQRAMYPQMVHKGGKYAKYKKYNKVVLEVDASNPFQTADAVSDDETEGVAGLPPTTTQPASAFGVQSSQPKPSATTSTGFGSTAPATSSAFGATAPTTSSAFGSAAPASAPAQPQRPAFPAPASKPAAFGQTSTPGFGATSGLGQKQSVWGAPAATTASTPTFGQTAFGKPSTPGASPFATTSKTGSTPAFASTSFGKPSTPGTSTFGQPSQPSPTQSSQPGSMFGQTGQMGANKPSPFGAFAGQASPFGGNSGLKGPSPFAQAAQQTTGQTPAFSKETSTASTATLGSSSFGSFGQTSTFKSSPFATPGLSKESTMNGDSSKQPEPAQKGSGTFGLAPGGFKLGSNFKGDGTAKDDLPKPSNPGAGMFGAGFGAALGDAANKKPEGIKQEPGTEQQPSLKSIPAAKPDSPEPAAQPEEAPLPPDPTTYKAPKMPDISTFLPGFGGAATKKDEAQDVPIAGSPPINVTSSQTFSNSGGSEAAGPAEEEDDDWEDNEDSNEEYEDDDEDDEEEDDEEDDEEGGDDNDESQNEEDEAARSKKDKAYADFTSRMTKPSPKTTGRKAQARTPDSDQKTMSSSYTPAGLPKGPTFPPPRTQTGLSPRSPSPSRRSVTQPVGNMGLPPEIRTSTVPPPKPVEKPISPPKPTELTAGELHDEACDRVEAILNAPIEPTKHLIDFFTHTNYTGGVDNSGVGGEIEKVYKDANSMIHVIGLNARSLNSFLTGQQDLRKPGRRSVEDLEDLNAWCLGDLQELGQVVDSLGKQLEQGKLDHIREKILEIAEEDHEVQKLKVKTTEMRKQITAHTDPARLAMQEAAPLSAETQAQQAELRQGVQRVQKLLSEVEEKMTMLRADLASAASSDRSSHGQTPVPTMEAVTNTIMKMTAMVEQKSGDIDVLEAQIKRLPNGIASLRMDDDYENDLARQLAGNNLLNGSPVATPKARRMAPNGDALGMSGMFGVSGRFSTPPSGRRSQRFTPEASGLGRSTGCFGGSARKKMTDVSQEEVDSFRVRTQKRKAVLSQLKGVVEKRGGRVVTVK